MRAGESDFKTRIIIQGLPVCSGRVLTPEHPAFRELKTVDDYCAFAQKIRGPFAIIVHERDATTAVTDFGACFYVYYLRDSARKFHVALSLGDLRQHSSGQISPLALFFYAALQGVGIDPMYADVKTVHPATVMRFAESDITAKQYLNWDDYLDEQPITKESARSRFIEIASEYLSCVIGRHGMAGCFLSGGTDSAIVAYLLKEVCPDVTCFTADYSLRRYSEYSRASEIARRLHIRHERVIMRRSDYAEAFRSMNNGTADLPTHDAHAMSLYTLAKYGKKHGVRRLFHGENAGAIFMEFDHFFAGLPNRTSAYVEHLSRLTTSEKLLRLAPELPPVTGDDERLLLAFDCSLDEYQDWRRQLVEKNRHLLSSWVGRFPFSTLSQLPSQLWAGVPLQNAWFAAQRGIGGDVQLLSPFLDIKMIRFGLSLPIELKFDNGITKAFLREFLKTKTGISLPKVASSNPSRGWRLVPHSSVFRVDERLKPLLVNQLIANVLSMGRTHATVARTAALGIWLRSHNLGDVASLI